MVISNLWADATSVRSYLASELGPDFFTATVFSSDIGINKPAKEIFVHALELADANTSRSAMVGDDWRRDVGAAQKLGMRAVYIGIDERGCAIADYHVPSLASIF